MAYVCAREYNRTYNYVNISAILMVSVFIFRSFEYVCFFVRAFLSVLLLLVLVSDLCTVYFELVLDAIATKKPALLNINANNYVYIFILECMFGQFTVSACFSRFLDRSYIEP